MYEVKIRKKAIKGITKMPELIQKKALTLFENLRERGPIRLEWPNFSALGSDNYHCHLARKWVACWKNEKNSLLI